MSLFSRDPEIKRLLGYPSDQASVPASAEVLPAGAGAPRSMVGGAYEGASRFDRELALWTPSFGSADIDVLGSKDMLDARVRDTARNDAFVRSGMDLRKDGIVGAMFLLNAKPAYKVLGLDEVWSEEFQEEVEAKFTLWAESVANWPDASLQNNLTAQIRLAVGLEMLTGEILASCEWITDRRRPYKTAIQMIDTDRLSNPPTIRETNLIRGGIHRNARGEHLGYYIRKVHPYDFVDYTRQDWKYIPARKPWGRQQIIYIREQFRPDQTRGVAAMVSALKETRIGKQFRDIMLQNAIVNATYAASIESDLPSIEAFSSLGSGDAEEIAGSIGNYAGGFLGALATYTENAKNTVLNGVKIPHLFPGTKLQLRPAGEGGPLGTEFEASLLRYLAANLNVSYEQLSRDYSQTNYSSMKGALNETHKGMLARKRYTADTFATHVYMLWLEEAIAMGEITSMPRNAPNFWDGLNREAYCACDWIGASRGQIDELKETQAAVLRLKYGLSTREDELARLGKDWRRVFSQLAREKTEQEKYDLVFQEDDNMMNAASGAPREDQQDGTDEGESDDADAG